MAHFKIPPFLSNSSFYEVNIRQYTDEGTFNAFKQHLPRLRQMGITVLWIMPIHPIGKVNRKGSMGSYYSIRDHKALNPEFGTEEDFHSLVQECRKLGMRVILDWVANHCAWDHTWTGSHPEYFIRNEDSTFYSPNDWTDVIQLDHSNPNQQRAMIDAMKFWITKYDIDGFRADLAHLTPLGFWKNARTELNNLKQELIWLAESEEPSYQEAFDITFTWRWMHEVSNNIGKLNGRHFKEFLQKDNSFYGLRLYFTSNHDENSWNGTEYEKLGEFALMLAVFSNNFNKGIPLIYSGQEIPNKKRLEFFEKDELQWSAGVNLHNFYRALLSIRRDHPAFSLEAGFEFLECDDRLMTFRRWLGDREIVTILNFSVDEVLFNSFNVSGLTDVFFTESRSSNVVIPPAGYKVFYK